MRAHLVILAASLAACTTSGGRSSGATVSPLDLEEYDYDSGDSGDSAWQDTTCPQPVAPISLAEAWDRGFADIWFDSLLHVENTGPYPILVDNWHIYFAEGSQDAAAGHADYPHGVYEGDTGDLLIPPGEQWMMAYTEEEGPAWWCVEKTQVTAWTMDFHFNGAEAPDILLDWVFYDTDENANGIEDHDEVPDPTNPAPQAQWNIWNTIAEGPVMVVGRVPNYIELSPGESTELTIEVINLGRSAASMTVTETIPAGTEAADFSIDPSTETRNSDGSTTYTWSSKMLASEDTEDPSEATRYATNEITYTLTWTDPACGERTVGEAPRVDWADIDAKPRVSLGTELVIACCP